MKQNLFAQARKEPWPSSEESWNEKTTSTDCPFPVYSD